MARKGLKTRNYSAAPAPSPPAVFAPPLTAVGLTSLSNRAASTSVLRDAIAKFDMAMWGIYRDAALVATAEASLAYINALNPDIIHTNYVVGYEIGGQYGNVTDITRVGTTVTVTTDNLQSATTVGQRFGLFGDTNFGGLNWLITSVSGSVGGVGTIVFTASGGAASAANETGIVNLVVYQMVNTANFPYITKFFAEDWTLRTLSPSGPYTAWSTSFNAMDTNLAFCPVDANGDDWIAYYIKDTQAFVFANCAGFKRCFLDNYINPRLDVINGALNQNKRDWQRSGIQQTYNAALITAAHAAGYARGAALVESLSAGRAKSPDLTNIGNIDTGFTTAGWENTVGGAFLENLFTPTTTNAQLITQVQWVDTVLPRLKAPQEIVINGNGSSITNYKDFRYAFCNAKMRPACYFMFDGGSYNNTTWYDEYDALMGSQIGANQIAPLAGFGGLWINICQGGWYISNPTAAPITVNLLVFALRHLGASDFAGRTPQDPVVNNGANVTSLTVPAKDGVVLVYQ